MSSFPAVAVGAELTFVMLTVVGSVSEVPLQEAVKRNVSVAPPGPTSGAVNEATSVVAPTSVTLGPLVCVHFFFQAEDGIRDGTVTGVQTCALPICKRLRVNRRRMSATGTLWPPS